MGAFFLLYATIFSKYAAILLPIKRTIITKKETHTFEGIISTTGRGTGFVALDGFEEDILVERENMHTALNGDTVEIKLLPQKKSERAQGEVVRILERGKTQYVGTTLRKNGEYFLRPDNTKMYTLIRITNLGNKVVSEDDKALVEFEGWKKGKEYPSGILKEVFGKKGDHEVEMQSIIADRGIVYDFPPEVNSEAETVGSEAISDKELDYRRDFRGTLTFTIDPIDAKDFDDALSFKELEDGNYEIGIHIADVSHYVLEGSELDKEARNRMFTTYLVDRTIPMLPEILSNTVCSLNPHEDRRAFSGVFVMNKDGKVLERWFGKTLIYSDRRFTYEDAQESINNGGDHQDALIALNTIAKQLKKKRFAHGAINFADDEVRFKLDENGKPIEVVKKVRLDTHKLVEEFMLLCNREVAEFVENLRKKDGKERVLVYRVHDNPDHERLEELSIFLNALGYDFKVNDQIDGKKINALLKEVEGKSEESLVNTSLIRTMAKAIYSVKNIGHFGLAFDHYAHFTSPIRRYADLLVHRLMWKYLNDKSLDKNAYNAYSKMAYEASERELQVLEAERESIKFKQVEYLAEHVGEIFEGVISGVAEVGLFIEEKNTKAQGLVRIATLGDEYFNLNKKLFALVGEKTKTKYTLGDEVKFKLVNADVDRRQLDFELV